MAITVDAHAKINLHLQILGLRGDGYHDVVTVLQSLALHDTLTCEARPGPFELRCDRADMPLDASNLVWRAAALIAERAGMPGPADAVVTLDKRIPMQAGLGGGSADAAAALVAFARLWNVPIDDDGLGALARRLGADVAFCLHGGTALGTGRGDELSPLPDLPPHAALIVMPPFGVSTPDAYRWHDERVAAAGVRRTDGAAARADLLHGRTAADDIEATTLDMTRARATADIAATPREHEAAISRWPTSSDDWSVLLPHLFNDFEAVVGARFAEVPRTVAALRAAGARFAALSGSGSAIVGLFDTVAQAEAARAATPSHGSAFAGPGWRTFVTETVASGPARA